MTAESILTSKYPKDVVTALLAAYREIEQNHFLGKWKASELDAGHFVEAARRIIDHALFGTFTPIGKDLPKFNEAELKRYESGKGDESLRILIPRVLWSVYGIRNKRGVGHVGAVSPNKMDASLILADVKWVLAEFMRLASGLSTTETQQMIDDIVERRLDLIWKHGDVTRVLDPKIKAADQVLLLLYDTSPQKLTDLQTAIDYSNPTSFRGILKDLHAKRLIEFNSESTMCVITTRGISEAEKTALKHSVVA